MIAVVSKHSTWSEALASSLEQAGLRACAVPSCTDAVILDARSEISALVYDSMLSAVELIAWPQTLTEQLGDGPRNYLFLRPGGTRVRHEHLDCFDMVVRHVGDIVRLGSSPGTTPIHGEPSSSPAPVHRVTRGNPVPQRETDYPAHEEASPLRRNPWVPSNAPERRTPAHVLPHGDATTSAEDSLLTLAEQLQGEFSPGEHTPPAQVPDVSARSERPLTSSGPSLSSPFADRDDRAPANIEETQESRPIHGDREHDGYAAAPFDSDALHAAGSASFGQNQEASSFPNGTSSATGQSTVRTYGLTDEARPGPWFDWRHSLAPPMTLRPTPPQSPEDQQLTSDAITRVAELRDSESNRLAQQVMLISRVARAGFDQGGPPPLTPDGVRRMAHLAREASYRQMLEVPEQCTEKAVWSAFHRIRSQLRAFEHEYGDPLSPDVVSNLRQIHVALVEAISLIQTAPFS